MNTINHPPMAIAKLPFWLLWRYESLDGEKKPRKMPYYANATKRHGTQGTEEDRAQLVTFEKALQALQHHGGAFDGVGFATLADAGIVALDFDNCVEHGRIDASVEEVCAGTYSELSPSAKGVRAFFRGSLRSRKDPQALRGDFAVEVFGDSGFVTYTGNATEACRAAQGAGVVADVSERVMHMYRERWDDAPAVGESQAKELEALQPRTDVAPEDIPEWLQKLPPSACDDRQDWIKVGLAMHHQTGGGEEGFEMWDSWSRGSNKYPGEDACRREWMTFGRNACRRPVTFASIIQMANEHSLHQTYASVRSWKDRLKKCDDEFELREKLCRELRSDASVPDAHRASLAYVLQERLDELGAKLPITECRALLARPKAARLPTVRSSRPLTQFGNAERLADRFASELMYVPELASWYCWTGVYWRRASEVEIEFRAKAVVKALPDEANEHPSAKEFFGFCAASQSKHMVASMISLAASDPRLLVPATELDRHKHLVGVQNGVVDLNTGDLLEADPQYRITRVCGTLYDPDARAPLFERTMSDVFFGDHDLVEFFQRCAGYALSGDPAEDVMLIPHGNGANGKSTVMNALRRAFGSYARVADATTFLIDGKANGNAGGAREDLVRLHGSRLIVVNEPDEGGELREGTVKSMTGGDPIAARAPYAKHSIEIVPTWVVFMPTNHKPIVKGSDNGIWRRLRLIPFTRNFEADATIEKDPAREEKLASELPGILAWIVRGTLAYRSGGLAAPNAVVDASATYRNQMDLLADWLDECCEIGDEFIEESQKLWQSWERWARERGTLHYVKSTVALGRRLDQRFPPAKGSRGVRSRVGLRVKPFLDVAPAASVAGVAIADLFS